MVVPINLLPPILDDLQAKKSTSHRVLARHVFGKQRQGRGLSIDGRGPASAAGLRRGDIVSDVRDLGVDGLADFYRKVWSSGPAGTEIPVRVVRDNRDIWLRIKSADRSSFLKKPRLQ